MINSEGAVDGEPIGGISIVQKNFFLVPSKCNLNSVN
jgi:hypothetical protein